MKMKQVCISYNGCCVLGLSSQQPSHFWMSKKWSGLIELIYLPTKFSQCVDIPWMLHENVMMVLHWRTSSFFVVKCFCWFPVCLTPIEDIQHHLADLNLSVTISRSCTYIIIFTTFISIRICFLVNIFQYLVIFAVGDKAYHKKNI